VHPAHSTCYIVSLLDVLQMMMMGFLFVGGGIYIFFSLRSATEPRVRRFWRSWFVFELVGIMAFVASCYFLFEMISHHTTYIKLPKARNSTLSLPRFERRIAHVYAPLPRDRRLAMLRAPDPQG
jgi:hypothetical protein